MIDKFHHIPIIAGLEYNYVVLSQSLRHKHTLYPLYFTNALIIHLLFLPYCTIMRLHFVQWAIFDVGIPMIGAIIMVLLQSRNIFKKDIRRSDRRNI